MTSSSIQWVVFDLGGVLVRICHHWRQAADRAGLPNFMDVDDPVVRDAIHQVLADYEVNAITSDDLLTRLARISTGHSPADIRAIIDAWLIDLYDGVGDLLDDLHRRNLRTACLSNTNDLHWRLMFSDPRFAALGKLQHPLASHLIAARKPQPAIYEHLETVTRAAPSGILFFDDLPANIEAAQARGWRGRLIDPAGDTVRQMLAGLRDMISDF
ncbi:MAG: HAD-IA family hydrolase [Phycisphaeraceae bacterium]